MREVVGMAREIHASHIIAGRNADRVMLEIDRWNTYLTYEELDRLEAVIQQAKMRVSEVRGR